MFLKAEAFSPIDLAAYMHLRTFLADDKPAMVSEHVRKASQNRFYPSAPNNNDFSMDMDSY
jgi:hypothetical protein